MKKLSKYILAIFSFVFLFVFGLTSCNKVDFKDDEHLQMICDDENMKLSFSSKTGLPTYYLEVDSSIESLSMDEIDEMIHLKPFYKYGIYEDFLGTIKFEKESIRLKYGYNDSYIIVKDRKDIESYTYLLSIYRVREYNIMFVLNEHEVQNITVSEKDQVNLPDFNYEKKGYDFIGWKYNYKIYDFPFYPSFEEQDIVMKATYNTHIYHINYELNGGILEKFNPNSYSINTPMLTFNSPTKSGYTFVGWYLDKECTIPYDISVLSECNDLTLYAYYLDGKIDALYSLNENNTYSLKKVLSDDLNEIIVKDNIDGIPVTTIEEVAFANHNEINRVFIPSTIKEIKLCAFSGCKNLQSIFIPSSVETIGENVFTGCDNLTILFEDSFATIKSKWTQDVFFSVQIFYEVTSAGYNLGSYWYNTKENEGHIYKIIPEKANGKKLVIETLIDGNQIRYIDSFALKFPKDHILMVEEIYIGSGLYEIREAAFRTMAQLKKVEIADSSLDISLTIANNVFDACHELTSIKLPKNLKVIENEAFSNCLNLKELYIPSNVDTIGSSICFNCNGRFTFNLGASSKKPNYHEDFALIAINHLNPGESTFVYGMVNYNK